MPLFLQYVDNFHIRIYSVGVWNNAEATNLKAKDFQRRDLNNIIDCYLANMYQTNDNIVLCRYFKKPKPQQIQQKKKLEIIMK